MLSITCSPSPGLLRSELPATSVDFDAAWCATDLGDHRPCRFTYERYPWDTLPPLDEQRFTGAFAWLGEPGAFLPERAARLRRVEEVLAAEGLSLPTDFVTFETSSNFAGSLDEVSVTGCWSSLSEPLPSPVEAGAFLVRFFRDQQDCVLWYLYLRPSGETFVVSSHLDYEFEYGRRESAESEPEAESEAESESECEYGIDWDDLPAQRAALLWSAPSFEHFAYRFWIENRLWEVVNGTEGAPLDPAMREYLDHYATAGGTVRP
ncbi:hypothetical protein [Kitasatospora camelliae]|uniref:SUKH-4 immunity protein of toxin-antitoxin system n=1 Tax=Kitasatospora camelliae TaxID=3156397 RepID=A0AAU8JPQ5_9ACTN